LFGQQGIAPVDALAAIRDGLLGVPFMVAFVRLEGE
jgi:hypothetical protein